MSGINLALGEKSTTRIVQAIQQIMQGRDNASGSVTLAVSAATTTVSAPNCAETSRVFLQPVTADAAAEIAAGGCYVSAVANSSFTITHANNSKSDRTFHWTARG
jgi:hypothetical protein